MGALVLVAVLMGCASGPATHPSEAPTGTAAEGWPLVPFDDGHVAGLMSEHVHGDGARTAWCGCAFTADADGGGATVDDAAECGFEAAEQWPESAGRVAWSRVVPDARLPLDEHGCWTVEGGDRDWCIRQDAEARAMLLDLHNRLPVIEQVARYRGERAFGTVAGEDARPFGACPVGVSEAAFEPPDCRKGDVARTWWYMDAAYGLELSEAEAARLERWAAADPVSPRELARARRIERITGRANDHVQDVEAPDPAGACPRPG